MLNRWQITWTNDGLLSIGPLGSADSYNGLVPNVQQPSTKPVMTQMAIYIECYAVCSHINSLSPGRSACDFECVNFKHSLGIDLEYSSKYCTGINTIGSCWYWVNIGSGNGLVPSGNKPLPEPILTQIYVTMWHHQATMGVNLQFYNFHINP